MELEQDDIKFSMLLQQKQHRQLLYAMQDLVKEIGQNKPDSSAVKAALESHAKAIENLVNTLSNVPKPSVNIQNNNESILAGIQAVADQIKEYLSGLNNKEESEKEWNFTVNRNRNGFIQNIVAKSK